VPTLCLRNAPRNLYSGHPTSPTNAHVGGATAYHLSSQSSRQYALGSDYNEAGRGDWPHTHGVTTAHAHAWNGWRGDGRGLDQAAALNIFAYVSTSYCSCFKSTMYPQHMNPRVQGHPSTCLECVRAFTGTGFGPGLPKKTLGDARLTLLSVFPKTEHIR
jgi:hypothetical protein